MLAGERNRTPNKLITNQLLYRLSYASKLNELTFYSMKNECQYFFWARVRKNTQMRREPMPLQEHYIIDRAAMQML